MPNTKPRTPNPESHFFGSRRVAPREKTGLVQEVFASVAGRYDLMNDLMSGGLHRLWKDRLVRLMNPQAWQTILDVAGGTGDITLRCARRTESKARIIVCDLSPAMLAEGRAKMVDQGILSGIKWLTGNAEDLPLPARSVDIYCIAFGLRNVTHIDKALIEAARVLKPGGRFYCLEFSSGVSKRIKPFYERYCTEILPRLGGLVAQDRTSYQYLAESIQKFPDQPALAKRMQAAGLEQVKWLNLTGGIAVIHSAWKM
jgi:demethylmenaquinone methyltransferase / 2-methoxy-6-polyprenyl-1,4-benzoquinol methylase